MIRIGTFNIRGLSGKVDLVQKLIDSKKLDVVGLTKIWDRLTDSVVLPMAYEALYVEPTGNRKREEMREWIYCGNLNLSKRH